MGEVRVGVVDARQEADLAALEEPLDAAADAPAERRVEPEARARERHALHLQVGAQVGVAAVGVQRHERVEQVDPAGRKTDTSTGAFGAAAASAAAGLEHALDRHRLGDVERQPAAHAEAQHLAAGERPQLLGAVEVVAGAVGLHQCTWASGPEISRWRSTRWHMSPRSSKSSSASTRLAMRTSSRSVRRGPGVADRAAGARHRLVGDSELGVEPSFTPHARGVEQVVREVEAHSHGVRRQPAGPHSQPATEGGGTGTGPSPRAARSRSLRSMPCPACAARRPRTPRAT